MIEMFVDSVRTNQSTQQHIVVLKAKGQESQLFIWIAQGEAFAIASHLQDKQYPRPLTHDLLKTIIEGTGFSVQEVRITRLEGEIYYAEIVLLAKQGETIVFDARPSDAFALAVRTQAPILVAEEVLATQQGVFQQPKDA